MSTATTTRGALGNLPAEVTSFIGRRHDVSEVRRLLTGSRLVTLTGTGGVGKTRLAQRVGLELRRAFPDGVWFVGLAELRDEALLAVTVAEVLGIREDSVSSGATGLAGHLADKQVLLVLDNCEQIIAGCADLAETLLRACPDLRILATSRQALLIAGEATVTVQPLAVPGPRAATTPTSLTRYEATSLFVDRATAVMPAFTLTPQNGEVVARLCQALEGIPLAIELATARLRVLSLEQILDRLTDRYRLLTTGTRDAPARQRTLRALIDWSWELCSPAERTLWARLSVFSGGLELDTAEAVCADPALSSDSSLSPDSILDLIASLVDKSVLVRAGDGRRVRYRQLEVIREYGAVRLAEAGEQQELARRHSEWFAGFAARCDARWFGSDQGAVMQRLSQEQGNLRVALEFAVTHGSPKTALRFAADLENHWFVRGFLSEGRHWLDRALAMPAPHHWTRVKALRVASWIAIVQSDRPRAEALLADAEALADTLPPSVERAYIPVVRGTIAMFGDDHTTAIALFETALAGFRQAGARSGELWALSALGVTRGLSESPSRGYADLIACRDLAASGGEVWWRSFALWALGVLHWQDGDTTGAAESARDSLDIRQPVADEQFGVGLSLELLAWIAGTQHRDRRAAQLLGASQRVWQAMHATVTVFHRLRGFHDDCFRQVRERMGATAFDAALRRGVGLATAAAIELALERQDRPDQAVANPPVPRRTGATAALTRREREVALLIAEGLSNREIAARLVVAQRTAEGHVENLLSKLGFTSRSQVAAWQASQPPP